MLIMESLLELAEVNETGVDEQERHIFTDADLAEFAKQVLAAGTARLLNALDCMDHGCREPGFNGHENGLGDSKAGDELQAAREELAAFVEHQAVSEPVFEG